VSETPHSIVNGTKALEAGYHLSIGAQLGKLCEKLNLVTIW
jgi:hypothetical protein